MSNHNDFQSDIVYSQIDSTGKIVLTKNMLEYYGFRTGDSVRIIYTEGAILVQKQPKKNQIWSGIGLCTLAGKRRLGGKMTFSPTCKQVFPPQAGKMSSENHCGDFVLRKVVSLRRREGISLVATSDQRPAAGPRPGTARGDCYF